MTQLNRIFRRVQFVYRRSQTATKVVVILALVLSMGALITLRLTMTGLQNETDALARQAKSLSESNAELTEDIANLGSVQSVVDIAEEKLDLIQPGTVVYQPQP